jgi:hypothetical protein
MRLLLGMKGTHTATTGMVREKQPTAYLQLPSRFSGNLVSIDSHIKRRTVDARNRAPA